jgi:NitT/TauT family transport system substrate-binding protein
MARNVKKLMAGVVAAAVALTSAACGSNSSGGGGSAGASGSAQTVSIGISSLNASHMWEFIARDENIFPKYGVNLKLVVFQGASQVLPSLLGGSTQVSEPSAPQAVAAMQKQSGFKIVVGSLVGSPLSLVVRKGINSVADLKGKKISVNAAGSSSDYYSAVAYLSAHGLSKSDVTYVTGGATSARVSALLSGAVDAVLCSPPDIERLTKAGDTVLGNVNDLPQQKNALAYVGMVKSSWAQANHDTLVKFIEGYQATLAFMRDPANHDKVVADIAKELNTDTQGADDVYTYFIKDAEANLDPTGAVSVPSLTLALQAAEVPAVPASTLTGYIDNSFAQEAAQTTGAKPVASSSATS